MYRSSFCHDDYYIDQYRALKALILKYSREKRSELLVEAIRFYIGTLTMYADHMMNEKWHMHYERSEIHRVTNHLPHNNPSKCNNESLLSLEDEKAHCERAIGRAQFIYLHHLWSYNRRHDLEHKLSFIMCYYYMLLAYYASLHFRPEIENGTNNS